MTGVYAIENEVNGKLYIGSSTNIHRRMKHHASMLCSGKHYNLHLQSAWDKYGENNFKFYPIIFCNAEDVANIEQKTINDLGTIDNGYNIAPEVGTVRGIKHSLKSRMQMSMKRRGIKHTSEWIAKIAESNVGLKRRPETCERIRISKIKEIPDRPDSCPACLSKYVRSTGRKWNCRDCGKYWAKYPKRGMTT